MGAGAGPTRQRIAGRFASQFARPHGPLGRLAGHLMVRGNGDFVRWSIDRLSARFEEAPDRVAEIGSGPGVGLQAALAAFPTAGVVGVDPSSAMVAMARRRNRRAIAEGRLTVVEAEAGALVERGPFDLVWCTHVIYFWQEPVAVLASIRSALRPGGLLGLGYQLAKDMPAVSREQFPALGHTVYESDEEVDDLIRAAGFSLDRREVKGRSDAPQGRVAIASR